MYSAFLFVSFRYEWWLLHWTKLPEIYDLSSLHSTSNSVTSCFLICSLYSLSLFLVGTLLPQCLFIGCCIRLVHSSPRCPHSSLHLLLFLNEASLVTYLKPATSAPHPYSPLTAVFFSNTYHLLTNGELTSFTLCIVYCLSLPTGR